MPDDSAANSVLCGFGWHRITFDRPDWDLFDKLNSPATCSCGEQWTEAMFAICHAYSANAVLEESLYPAKYWDNGLESGLLDVDETWPNERDVEIVYRRKL